MPQIHSILVSTYDEFEPWRDDFLRPAGLNVLFVFGPPGTGKSSMFQSAAGGDVFFHQGPLSGSKFYATLYENKDKAIVFDDVDQLLTNPDNVNLMKMLCQTEAIKDVSWRKHSWRMERDNVPDQFATTSRVCVLANRVDSLNENLRAVMDRGHVVEFRPSVTEIHRQAGKWPSGKDDEVYAFIGDHLTLISDPSLRWYYKAAELKALGRDWKRYLLDAWTKNTKLALAARILTDPTLTTAEARVKRFAEQGGGSRDTFMRYQRQMKAIQGREARSN